MNKKKDRKKKLLEKVNFPKDVRGLRVCQLQQLSREVREFLICSVSKTGGHFGSNLGVVELTVALHYVFNTPKDKIIWDVGHQTYPHKILTGRKNKLKTIRSHKGLAPFPKRQESEFDCFGVGHSSTSISAGVGMWEAHKNEKDPPQVVAIIGDGALTGGMAFEALNHAGDIGADVLVILNDNEMSISPNVGAMHKYLTRLISSPSYMKIRKKGKKILGKMPSVQELVRRTEAHAKGVITQGTLFEELGFGYYGPIDGHNVEDLVEVLGNLKKIHDPKILHVVTTKGKGCGFAEDDKLSLHSIGRFDPKTGKKNKKQTSQKTYTDIFSDWICKVAENDKKIHAITPAMCEGSGLVDFRKKFPDRYHDVGIAEQHAVTFAAGLACEGKKPIVAIYSSFFQRAYDQLIHDVAIQNLDVLFAVDRAGIVGPDGATHAGSFDFSFLRAIPNLIVMAPENDKECQQMLESGYKHKGPVIVRYPRECVVSVEKSNPQQVGTLEIGKGRIVRHGKKVAILAFGVMVEKCRIATEKYNTTLVNMRFVKPLDENLLTDLAESHEIFVTVEDNTVLGGAGSAVCEFVCNNNIGVKVRNVGLPDRFLEHGTREEILADGGLSGEKICEVISKLVA